MILGNIYYTIMYDFFIYMIRGDSLSALYYKVINILIPGHR